MLKPIGSQLLKKYFQDSFYREALDKDYMISKSNLKIFDADLYNEWLLEGGPLFFQPKKYQGSIDYLVIKDDNPLMYVYNHFLKNDLSLEEQLYYLYLIKSSHKYFYLGKYYKSFKHLLDYSVLNTIFFHRIMTEQDKNFIKDYNNYLIKNVYNNDPQLLYFPNLDKSKEDFFNDNVIYYIDHDLIHREISINDTPAYTLCLTGEVKFSNKLFLEQSFEIKSNMVIEEAMVLALERCLLPLMFGTEKRLPAYSPHEAFKYALVRISTNITSGPFREFAANNFKVIYDIFSKKHIDYFKVINNLEF